MGGRGGGAWMSRAADPPDAAPKPRDPVRMGDAAEEMEAVLGGKAWDVGGSAEPPVPVRLGSSVCYVVLAVLFNAEDAVLLVQESKPRCRGLWYLPAGRVEPHESLAAALRREVREEAGLQCEPLTLLALEERGPMWVRFVFLARHTGERGGGGWRGVWGGLGGSVGWAAPGCGWELSAGSRMGSIGVSVCLGFVMGYHPLRPYSGASVPKALQWGIHP
uniref:Nudix hydrolase 18 n=1 Tax=Phasianus colchicus TaxID=9054 RepID=A0A669QWR7_PHACC